MLFPCIAALERLLKLCKPGTTCCTVCCRTASAADLAAAVSSELQPDVSVLCSTSVHVLVNSFGITPRVKLGLYSSREKDHLVHVAVVCGK